MPITSLFSSIGKFISYGLTLFTDNFNRTTSGSLGTSSSGSSWRAVSGTWSANGTQATSATAASSYPIASVSMASPSNTILLDVGGNGAGAAFWITDSANWWGVTPYQTSLSASACVNDTYGSTCSYSYANYACGYTSYNTAYCAVVTYYRPVYGGTSSQCSGWAYNGYTCSGSVISGYTCGGFSQTYACVGGYYTYYYGGSIYLRLTKSVAGVITTVVDQLLSSAVASIKVILSNGTITARAYTSPGQVTQTGSDLVNTPVGAVPSVNSGIILAPGGYSQSTVVDNITITAP
jgi:hypothetical protein